MLLRGQDQMSYFPRGLTGGFLLNEVSVVSFYIQPLHPALNPALIGSFPPSHFLLTFSFTSLICIPIRVCGMWVALCSKNLVSSIRIYSLRGSFCNRDHLRKDSLDEANINLHSSVFKACPPTLTRCLILFIFLFGRYLILTSKKKETDSWSWWCRHIAPAPGRKMLKEQKFKAGLHYKVMPPKSEDKARLQCAKYLLASIA